MANVIKLKRGSGSDPGANDLVVGEVAIRTDSGKLFTKKDNGSIAEISGSGGGASNFFINTLSSSSGSGGGSASFNGSATRFTLSNPPSVSAQQLLVSVNGVIQKPNSGTSPSEGFAIDGDDIIFAAAPATGADFFIITYAELAVGVPSDNSVTSAKIADLTIVNGDISNTASIAGTKISPDFGSQNISTTGTLNSGNLTITGAAPSLFLTESDSNPDYQLFSNGGKFKVHDVTNSADRLTIDSSGNVGIGVTDVKAALQINSGRNAETDRHDGSNYHLFLRNPADDNGEACGLAFSVTSNATKTGAAILHERDGGGSQGSMQFYTNGDGNSISERMRIDSAGRVGIGTTNPPAALHLHYGTDPSLNIFSTQHTQNTGSKINFGVGQSASSGGNTGARIEMNIPNSGGAMSGELKFFTNSGDNLQERMRINSSGNVGIGTTSPNNLLNIHGVFETNAFDNSNGQGGRFTAKGLLIGDAFTAGKTSSDDRNSIIWNERGLDIVFATSDTERMKIDSNGHIRFGATAAIQSEKFTFFRPESDGNTLAYFHQGASANVTGIIMRHGRGVSGFSGKMVGFLRNDGTEVGSITLGVSSTAFNTSSDYRLKENVTSITDGITRLKTLKPYRFNFKDDTTKPVVDGFFAHEVTAVPEAITGTKDQVDADNNPVYQSIDQSKLVPLLVAALQEAIVRIEALEAG